MQRAAILSILHPTKVNTSGYHPQCDGLVEKFNSTLINMLSKSVGKYGNDWDRRLPYVLFAYRVAVQDSTHKCAPWPKTTYDIYIDMLAVLHVNVGLAQARPN